VCMFAVYVFGKERKFFFESERGCLRERCVCVCVRECECAYVGMHGWVGKRENVCVYATEMVFVCVSV